MHLDLQSVYVFAKRGKRHTILLECTAYKCHSVIAVALRGLSNVLNSYWRPLAVSRIIHPLVFCEKFPFATITNHICCGRQTNNLDDRITCPLCSIRFLYCCICFIDRFTSAIFARRRQNSSRRNLQWWCGHSPSRKGSIFQASCKDEEAKLSSGASR
jgi:hypothetical protein